MLLQEQKHVSRERNSSNCRRDAERLREGIVYSFMNRHFNEWRQEERERNGRRRKIASARDKSGGYIAQDVPVDFVATVQDIPGISNACMSFYLGDIAAVNAR